MDISDGIPICCHSGKKDNQPSQHALKHKTSNKTSTIFKVSFSFNNQKKKKLSREFLVWNNNNNLPMAEAILSILSVAVKITCGNDTEDL